MARVTPIEIPVTIVLNIDEIVRPSAEDFASRLVADIFAEPMSDDQRFALFGVFGNVFTDSEQEKRYAFTRLVLGKSIDEPVSWSRYKAGALTAGEANVLLNALNTLDV